ncbi:MAG TPA: DUF2062 domain-containing protein [Thermoanaerobaculia bacterium]|nr:DUF2062 domain-containing protein [Thermoanaerobaculia bacterium]
MAVQTAPRRDTKLKHRLRELLYGLRIEGGTPGQQAAAVALGMFIGCTPLYGLHLPLCILCARWLGLNRVKTYLAAHISTPVLMPFLLFFEVQTGKLVRGKPLLSIRPSQVPERWHWDAAHLSFWHWKSWGDLLVGSVVLGIVLAAVCALVTYLLLRRGQRPAEVEALIEATAHRYLDAGLVQCEIVRGKLRHDPVYFALLRDGALPGQGRLLDLGCGRGIALALLAAAGDQNERAVYPQDWQPPPELQLSGIDVADRAAQVARAGLDGRAAIQTADLLTAPLPQADAILMIDVLHYLQPADQQRLLSRVAGSLAPGGLLLVREADAAAGWRFHAIRLSERLMALCRRDWRQWREGFHYRSQAEWISLLAARGLLAKVGPMGMGTPYANVLIAAVRA